MGDRAGFDELFRREFPRLVRALSVAEGPEEAADAVQEAFVEADRRWSAVGAMTDPAGWVRRVAVNRLSNVGRYRRRRTAILAAVRPPDPAALGEADLDLLAAIRALPRAQRLAVCLHDIAGLPVAEVAESLGVATGTVKSNLHDARASLRNRLGVPDEV